MVVWLEQSLGLQKVELLVKSLVDLKEAKMVPSSVSLKVELMENVMVGMMVAKRVAQMVRTMVEVMGCLLVD